MNLTRIVVFCVALIAAGAAVLIMRGMLGGGTPAVQASVPPPATTDEVLVASKDIGAGRALDVDAVRWEEWPKSSVSDNFILKSEEPEIDKAVQGIVARAPLVAGQPITESSIVRAGSAGFLAATLSPGMRAVSMPLSEETGAGGFILPNDRVDVILTLELSQSGGNKKNFQSQTILRDVRVLAIGKSAEQPKDAQVAEGKTATVELTLAQSELIEESRMKGSLALALRPLGESGNELADTYRRGGGVSVIRYGVARNSTPTEGGVPQ
jgi:pilus assembly protein CpaB